MVEITQADRIVIAAAWNKKRQSHARIQRAAESCQTGGLTKLPNDEMEKRFEEQAAAIEADRQALEEVEAALKDAGILY